ncbi:MAG: hypothetical protein ABJC62_10915 [Frankiaceae bacterium]
MTATATPTRRKSAGELPVGFRIALDGDIRRHPRADGGVLLGGSPLRVLRLNATAWAALTDLDAGSPVRSRAEARVAGRLVGYGLARPLPGPAR